MRQMIRSALLILAIPMMSGTGAAGQELRRDSTWVVEASSTDSLYFVVMHPGWHATTSSATTLYQPDSIAAGNYVLKSVLYFFEATDQPYGIMLAGESLGSDSASYLIFQIRNDGAFSIRHRAGDEMHQLQPWTASEAVVRQDPDTSSPVKNVLAVYARGNQADFYVNGVKVSSLAAQYLHTAGVFGLALGAGVNLHVGELTAVRLGES